MGGFGVFAQPGPVPLPAQLCVGFVLEATGQPRPSRYRRGLNELSRLLVERVGYFRIRVTEHANRNSTSKIKISPAICIPNITPLPALKHKVEPCVGRHNKMLKRLANLLGSRFDVRRSAFDIL